VKNDTNRQIQPLYVQKRITNDEILEIGRHGQRGAFDRVPDGHIILSSYQQRERGAQRQQKEGKTSEGSATERYIYRLEREKADERDNKREERKRENCILLATTIC
jgi:hypothetical protein